MVLFDTNEASERLRYASTCAFHFVRLNVPSAFLEPADVVRLTTIRSPASSARLSCATIRDGSAR